MAARALTSPHTSKDSSVTVASRTPLMMGTSDRYTCRRSEGLRWARAIPHSGLQESSGPRTLPGRPHLLPWKMLPASHMVLHAQHSSTQKAEAGGSLRVSGLGLVRWLKDKDTCH